MIHDSEEWRVERDKLLIEALQDQDALAFVRLVGEIGEQWDDVVDGDMTATPQTLCRLMWMAIVDLQTNPFYERYRGALLPVMMVGMNAWQDSLDLEAGDRQERALAYCLRDLYLEVISMSIFVLHGYDAMRKYSARIRQFLKNSHETIDEYLGVKP